MTPKHLQQIRANYPEPTHGWCANEEALFLYALCHIGKIDRVIEGGTCNGWSASWMAMALEERQAKDKVYTFDVEKKPVIFTGTDVESRIVTHIKPFHEGVHEVEKKLEHLRTLYFIDGDHSEVGVRNDWRAVERYMKYQDLAVFHDTRREWKFPGIKKILSEIRPKAKYAMLNMISLHGLATIRKCHKR